MQELLTLFLKQKKNIPSKELWPASWKTVHYKIYERGKRFLWKARHPSNHLKEMLLKRKSAATFSGTDVPIETILELLRYAAGTQQENAFNRTYASGGGLYPIEIYYINKKTIDDFKQGVYHFNPKEHSLSFIKDTENNTPLSELIGSGYDFINNASGIVCFTAVPSRTTDKYGWLGIRACLFDIGQIIQNCSLLAESMGLRYRPIAGFTNEKVDSLLEIDGQTELCLLTYVVGA